jgi:hypothetical protein
MAIIKKFAENLTQPLTSFGTFLVDTTPTSTYFKITEFKDTFTGGKNGFLIEGSEHLMESTEIKIQILDVNGDPIYYEPGNGVPEYYEGTSKLVAVYVYEDTPIGTAKITVLGELKTYLDEGGAVLPIPDDWKNVYNVKWEREFKVNRLLSNEDKVRFYRRPEVTINEIVKPIFNNVTSTITQTGSLDGIAQSPRIGEQLSGFTAPTTYLLSINDTTNWTGSVVGTTISIPSLGYSTLADSVITNKNLLVTNPYTLNNLVSNFSNAGYTASFNYTEGTNNLKTALTGSFAKINISDLTTFVGDVARVKIFRKSQSDLADYQFVQEIRLESNEILRDLESQTKNEEFYGIFDNNNYTEYWTSSAAALTASFNQSYLFNSIKFDSNGVNNFYTSKSLNITNGTEYTLDFNLRVGQGQVLAGNYVNVFLSGSTQSATNPNQLVQIKQNIITITSDSSLLQKNQLTANFKAEQLNNAKLYFEIKGNGWYIADVSLRASQETAYSPDEITFIQSVPRTLPEETFLYRFEFYDINNNFIPVLVDESKTFNGGNLQRIQKGLVFTPRSLQFQFDSGSQPVPPTVVGFTVTKNLLTGSVTYTSQSFDFDGIELFGSDYTASFTGQRYPGLLSGSLTDAPTMTVGNFTGSRLDKTVQLIKITGEVEGFTDTVIFTRVLDGFGGVNHLIRPYRGTQIRNSSTASLELQAVRIDGVNDIELSSTTKPEKGWPDKQLHILVTGSSATGFREKFVNLEYALSSGYIYGLNSGSLGSGEINYNAVFNRDSIDFRRTVYLISSQSAASDWAFNTSGSVVASIILEDLQDGLDSGKVLFNVDTFTINPRTQTTFTPLTGSATASFAKRGTAAGEIESVTSSFEIYPSMSINKDWVPEYWMYYHTKSLDPTLTVVARDENNKIIPSQGFGNFRSPLSQSKNLTLTFVYTEPWTSASVSIDKTFTIVPEGKQGDESIVFEVNPISITLGANSKGIVNDYIPSITDIRLKQGARYLSFSSSASESNKLETHGTFYILNASTSSIIDTNVTAGNVHFTSSFGTPYTASLIVSASSNMTDLSGSIEYPLIIHPYFTSSIYTASVIVNYTKVLEGAPPIQIVISPIAASITADEVGFITPAGYSAANTTIQVKEGDDFLKLTTTESFANADARKGTYTINSILPPKVGDKFVIITGSFSSSMSSSKSGLEGRMNYHLFDYPFISASALYTIQVYPYALGAGHQPTSSIYTRTQTFTKNVTPPKARSVDFKASSYIVSYDRNGRVSAASQEPIILSATAFNTTASADRVSFSIFEVNQDGSENFLTQHSGSFGTNPVICDAFDPINYNDISPDTIKTFKVKITDGNPHESSTLNPYRAEAQLTISGMKAGADAYKLVASNESTSITAELFDTNLSGTGMKITTFNGTQQLINANPLPLPNSLTDLDFNDIPIGVLGYSSASIFSKSPWIGITGGTPLKFPVSNPAQIGDVVSWDKPAINKTGEIVYRVDFEGDSSSTDVFVRPLARQTQFVTQSFAVQFTEPAPYDVKMQNENSSVVYRVSGEIEFTSTSTLISAYRGTYILTNKPTGFTGAQIDAYGSSSYEYQSTVEIVSKSDHITLAGGLIPGSKLPGTSTSASMAGVTVWSNPESNPTAEIVYGINCEGRQTIFKTQSLSVQYEGAVGPGIVMRGEWSNQLDYIGMVETTNNRRDAVTYLATPDTVKYYAAVSGSGPATLNGYSGTVGYQAPTANGTNAWWEYLGEQDFFVAAKIAIFEESYVKNTINVGTKDGTSGFANIVLAGGRPDPYMAIGQNATVGTAGTSGTTNTTAVIGYNKPGIFLGIYEDGGNGTTGRFSIKTTGTSGKGMSWDGDTLTIVGSIRQVEPGVSEGSLRGAWTSGFTYYTNDIVSYGGQSWRCTSAQAQSYQHIATNDTAALTGYPGSGPWAIAAAAGTSGTAGSGGTAGTAGTAGGPGPGVVYRGPWTGSLQYFKTTERTDVVKGSDNQYYIAKVTHTPNVVNAPIGTATRPIDGGSYATYWQSFGATFSSVATGLLLAENATVTKGLVIGQEGSDVGFIRSAGAQSIGGGNGFYMDALGNMRFGADTSTEGNYVYWNNALGELDINGTITADSGEIGGFTIANNQLIASGALLRFDTQAPSIEFYTNATGSAKVVLNPKETLTDPFGQVIYISSSKYDGTDGNRTSTSGTTNTTNYITEVYSGSLGISATSLYSGATTLAFTEPGNTNFIVYIPETSLTISTTTPTATSDYPPNPPSYGYETYQSEYASPGNTSAQWYVQMFNSTGTTFISEVAINGASTYRSGTANNSYYSAVVSYSGFPYYTESYYWNYSSYSSTAYYQGNIPFGSKAGQMIIPAAGIYQFRLVLKVTATSAAIYDYTGGSSTYYTTTGTSNHTTTGDITFQFSPNVNKTEITNGGIQVLSNQDAYVRFNRIEPSAYGGGSAIANFVGGVINVSAFGGYPTNLGNTGIYMNGGLSVYGTTNYLGDYYFSGTGTQESLRLGGRSTATAADQTYITSYSNFLPASDNYWTIGKSGQKWKQIWSNTGTIQTSDANQKLEIEQSQLGLDFINRLQPVSYKFISGSAITEKIEDYIKTVKEPAIMDSDGVVVKEEVIEYIKNEQIPNVTWTPGIRKHHGLVAQHVKTILDDMGLSTNDFAGYIEGDLENHSDLGLRYEEFMAPMIKAIQELSSKVNRLEAEISSSKI